MKTIFFIFAVVACVCAANAVPVTEPKPEEGVAIDLDKLAAELKAEFDDENFVAKEFDMQKLAGVNTQLIAGGKWMKYIPWGTIIDTVVDGIKKATE